MSAKQQRKCVACRQCKHQDELIRVARINGQLYVDEKHKMGGRGAYVCKQSACIAQTIKKRLLNRAYKADLDISIYEKLGEYEKDC